jgi:hypothetical protein
MIGKKQLKNWSSKVAKEIITIDRISEHVEADVKVT